MTTTTTAMDPIDRMRAQDQIRTTVMDNSFTVRHDVDGIVQELWDTFGHFDWDIIGHDTDRLWSIINTHETPTFEEW